jgi:hypothetical protein
VLRERSSASFWWRMRRLESAMSEKSEMASMLCSWRSCSVGSTVESITSRLVLVRRSKSWLYPNSYGTEAAQERGRMRDVDREGCVPELNSK